ncbi:MAG: hypothetical protein IT515_13960 [Burkholderiales bacterium]|nr:hypothetical protein [Burkholderiales bacterium]
MHLLDVPLEQLALLCQRLDSGTLFEALLRVRTADRADTRGAGLSRSPPLASCTAVARELNATIAVSAAELRAAGDLVARRYAWRGYAVDAQPVEVIGAEGPRRSDLTFIASDAAGGTVGTMMLRLDGPGGLLVDADYGAELAAMRSDGRRVCELTRLAVEERADSRSVLAALFGLAYLLGRVVHKATDVLIEVNPRHVAFYRRALGFMVEAGERLCTRVKAPSVLLRLKTEALELRLDALGAMVLRAPILLA